jgi:hypothetical protein
MAASWRCRLTYRIVGCRGDLGEVGRAFPLALDGGSSWRGKLPVFSPLYPCLSTRPASGGVSKLSWSGFLHQEYSCPPSISSSPYHDSPRRRTATGMKSDDFSSSTGGPLLDRRSRHQQDRAFSPRCGGQSAADRVGKSASCVWPRRRPMAVRTQPGFSGHHHEAFVVGYRGLPDTFET